MKHGSAGKYRILLLGCLLVLGGYFGIRTVQFLSMTTAEGEITTMVWGTFKVGVPPTSHRGYNSGDYKGTYQRPEIRFFYKPSASDTGSWRIVRPESYAMYEHKQGEKVTVIFPKENPQQARIYSLGEFWFTAPYMVTILVIILLWSVGFIVVVFKPWKVMDE